MKYNNKKNNPRIKKSTYVTIFLIIPFFLILSIYLLILSKNKVNKIISITEKSNINYSVCVKENDFYKDTCLDKGMQYIANLIDYIDINFNYELLTNEKVDYEYKYRIEAKINVFAKNDPNNIIYTDTKILTSEILNTANDKQLLKINENVKIDYINYNEKIRNFKNEYGVSADSDLKIRLYITPIIKYLEYDNEIVKDEAILELDIPLSENQINIKATTQDINNIEDVEIRITNRLKYIYLIGSITSAIIILILVILLIIAFSVPLKKITAYQKEVNKILREYDYIISEVDTIIDPDEIYYKYAEMKSFKDLKDMAINTEKQILCSELKELKKTNKTWFYIINEEAKMIYRFSISSDEKRFI